MIRKEEYGQKMTRIVKLKMATIKREDQNKGVDTFPYFPPLFSIFLLPLDTTFSLDLSFKLYKKQSVSPYTHINLVS